MEAFDEAVHPLALLTRDGWIHVLDRLDMPKDWWNAAHVHPLFRSIFQSNLKEKWLTAMFFGCVPQLLQFLPFPSVLELRLVDREIRSTIDQCFEQGQVSALRNYKNEINVRFCDLIRNAEDEDSEDEDLEDGQGFRVYTPTPITPWMNLELLCTEPGGVLHRFEDFLPFFSQYGPQVFNVTVSDFEYDGQADHILQQIASLRNLLFFIPNLEALQLGVVSTVSELAPHSCLADVLTDFIRDNPLPSLSSLNNLVLCVDGWPECEASVVSGAFLQRYGAQLHNLDLWNDTNAILPKGMSRLSELWFKPSTPEQLPCLQACGAPLEVLCVKIVENSPILPSQFFLALQPFQSTLKTLKLATNSWEFHQVEQVQVELPLVEVLRLEGGFSECTGNDLRILDSFPNLKELELWIVPSAENIDWVSYYSQLLEEEHFYKASIWTRLLKLQKVEIDSWSGLATNIRRTFSRDTWSTTLSCSASENRE